MTIITCAEQCQCLQRTLSQGIPLLRPWYVHPLNKSGQRVWTLETKQMIITVQEASPLPVNATWHSRAAPAVLRWVKSIWRESPVLTQLQLQGKELPQGPTEWGLLPSDCDVFSLVRLGRGLIWGLSVKCQAPEYQPPWYHSLWPGNLALHAPKMHVGSRGMMVVAQN